MHPRRLFTAALEMPHAKKAITIAALVIATALITVTASLFYGPGIGAVLGIVGGLFAAAATIEWLISERHD